MHRRKIISATKVKPKLVLDRNNPNSRLNDHEEASPISIVKIKEKENRKSSNLMPETGSSDKMRSKSLFKTTNFNVRHIPNRQESSMNRSARLLSLASSLPPQLLPNAISHQALQQFIDSLMRKLKISPRIFYFSGDLTLSCGMMTKILTTFIEESCYNIQSLQRINQKIDLFVYSPEEEDKQDICQKRAQDENKHKVPIMAISKSLELHLTLEADPISQLSTSQIHHAVQVQLEPASTESFVFAHLCDLEGYIMQQPNKILHQALRRHKYLQQELFAYADMVSISRVGSSTYTPQANIIHLEATLDRQMRDLNRQLVQGGQSLEQKGRLLRDYVLRVRKGYDDVLKELMKVIDQKTELAKTFVNKVVKWEENYLTRKEYLNNLKKQYCQQMNNLTSSLNKIADYENKRTLLGNVQASVANIHHIFLMGNSFY